MITLKTNSEAFMSIRVVIVEDEKNILESLNILLKGANTVKIVGAYSSGEIALDSVSDIAPDVALVDLKLKDNDISGIEVIKEIKNISPATEILVFTKFFDDKHLFEALKAGATGYLLKDATPREIIEAIEEVNKGGAPMSRKIARRVLDEFHTALKTKYQNDSSLTSREKEILEELSKGTSTKELADKFSITYETVRIHLKHIYKKLHVRSKVEAIVKMKEKCNYSANLEIK